MRVRTHCTNQACQAIFDTPLPAQTAEVEEKQTDRESVQSEINPQSAIHNPQLLCPRCGHDHAWNTAAVREELIEACPVCAGDELYVRKDFPQRLGVFLVIVVGISSFWFFARGDLLWAMGVLVALVVVDFVIYRLVPKVTVCYRCRTEFRGTPINPHHAGFDLATAEKYR